jgi:DNA (cytosine-5)-methyltransferase 1
VTDVAHTLTGQGFDASEDGTGRGTPIVPQPQSFNWQQGDAEYSLREDTTALAADSRPAVLVPEPQVFRKSRRPRSTVDDETRVDDGQANTLNVFDQGETRTTHAVVGPEYGVRRLTPVECERLQAFPDGWTEPAGSDSARYRALGNAVTVSTVGWILGRMRDVT